MQLQANKTKTCIIAFLAVLGTTGIASSQTQPDNTKANKGDADKAAVTADQQKMNAADRTLTQNIRKAVMADKSLSTYAHNVKIISQNGMVTLKGPVRSDDEKQSIVGKAVAVAGSPDKVSDQMSVTASSK
jgi:hyperosmotically inducible periplasmic protein